MDVGAQSTHRKWHAGRHHALLVKARDSAMLLDWLVRSKHNRTLKGGEKLWARVSSGEALGELRFTMAQRQGHKAREVIQQIWVQKVDLPDSAKGQVQASCIVAREAQPPEGEKPHQVVFTDQPASGQSARRRTHD